MKCTASTCGHSLDIVSMQELPRDLKQEILVARLQCMEF